MIDFDAAGRPVFSVTPVDRELYVFLGLHGPDEADAVLSGAADSTEEMQSIAGHREKQAILSTISTLSSALSALDGPPTVEMQSLLASSLGELQQIMEAQSIAPDADEGSSLGPRKVANG